MQDSVEVPEPPVMLVGLRLQVRPVMGDIVLVRSTVPVKPLTGLSVMVEVPVSPAKMLTLAGLALMMKSGAAVTVNETSTEWDSVPLATETVTV